MRTEQEAWLQEQLLLDEPAPMAPLDGREMLGLGRRRRRRRRIATATPLAVAGILILGGSLWVGQLLPDAVQDALPAVPGPSGQCLELAPHDGTSTDGGAGIRVTSDVTDLTVLHWVEPDGTEVWLVRTADGCQVPAEGQAAGYGGVGLSVLTQAPGGPVVLRGSGDPGEDAQSWGASLLDVPGQADAVAIVPGSAQQVALAGGVPVDGLTPVLDDQDHVVARVARLSYDEGVDPPGLLWQAGGTWSMEWERADVVAEPLLEEWGAEPSPSGTAELPSSSVWPQLARAESDGRWWIWVHEDMVVGPVEAPEGPWAIHLSDDGLGDAFMGWVPTRAEGLLVDGQTWDLLPLDQTVGEPLDGLKPFVRDVYQPARGLVAVGKDGERTQIPLIEAAPTN